jgi:hypothetical protein|tara:strand:+ start:45 stop:350 length:306 start_codon:yes stop_codon:yes gene_type:complete
MKKKIFIISMLCSSSALAKNAIIEEVLAVEDESVSTVLLQSCDVEIASANNDELRNKSKTKRLLQVKAANNVYYAPSIALFERDQGNCELVIKGLLHKETS